MTLLALIERLGGHPRNGALQMRVRMIRHCTSTPDHTASGFEHHANTTEHSAEVRTIAVQVPPQLYRTAVVAPLHDQWVKTLNQCIVRLQIAVQDAARVQVRHTKRQLEHHVQQERCAKL